MEGEKAYVILLIWKHYMCMILFFWGVIMEEGGDPLLIAKPFKLECMADIFLGFTFLTCILETYRNVIIVKSWGMPLTPCQNDPLSQHMEQFCGISTTIAIATNHHVDLAKLCLWAAQLLSTTDSLMKTGTREGGGMKPKHTLP